MYLIWFDWLTLSFFVLVSFKPAGLPLQWSLWSIHTLFYLFLMVCFLVLSLSTYQDYDSMVGRSHCLNLLSRESSWTRNGWLALVVVAVKLQPIPCGSLCCADIYYQGLWGDICVAVLCLLPQREPSVLHCRELWWFSSSRSCPLPSPPPQTLCCILQTPEPMSRRHDSGWSNGSTTRSTGSGSRPTPSATPRESNTSGKSTGKSDSAKSLEPGRIHSSDIVERFYDSFGTGAPHSRATFCTDKSKTCGGILLCTSVPRSKATLFTNTSQTWRDCVTRARRRFAIHWEHWYRVQRTHSVKNKRKTWTSFLWSVMIH